MSLINLINQRMSYNPKNGKLRWKQRTKSFISTVNIEGYLRFHITYENKVVCVLAHRAAWALHYGEWPKNQIDHINGVRADNKISNLRDVSDSINRRNQKIHRAGKLWGAHRIKDRWQSSFRLKWKKYHQGTFATELEAHKASNMAMKKALS